MSKQSFNVTVLDSGLTVVTDYLPEAKTSSSFWNLNAGADRDLPGREGCAHFFEHLLGAGHKYDPDFDVIGVLDRWGGGWELYTGPEYTSFHGGFLPRRVSEFISMSGAMVCHSLLDKDRIEKERGIIRREWFEGLEDAGRHFKRQKLYRAFGNEGFARDALGSLENIMKMSREDMVEYRDNFYLSEDMTFGMSGPVPHEHVVKLAEQAFKDLKRGKNPELQKPPFVRVPHEWFESRSDQQKIAVVFELPDIGHPLNGHTSAVVDSIQTQLGVQMRDAGHVYSLSMGTGRFRGGSYVSIDYDTQPENAQKSLHALGEFLLDARRRITRETHDALKEKEEYNNGIKVSHTGARAYDIYNDITKTGRVVSYEEIVERDAVPELDSIVNAYDSLLRQPVRVITTGPCREVIEFDIKGGKGPLAPEISKP